MTAITQVTREYIAVNDLGYRIGSSHHNSSISDQVIDGQDVLIIRETVITN